MQRRCVVVWPQVVTHLAIESRVVVAPLTSIEDPEVRPVPVHQEPNDLLKSEDGKAYC